MSYIPGPKPPRSPAAVNKATAYPKASPSEMHWENATPTPSKEQAKGVIDHLDTILDRPTSDLAQETWAVADFAIDESKTVGGLSVTLLTLGAFIATSPWSWIAALLLGPAGVWGFLRGVVTGGIGAILSVIFLALMLFSLVAVVLIGWLIFKASA